MTDPSDDFATDPTGAAVRTVAPIAISFVRHAAIEQISMISRWLGDGLTAGQLHDELEPVMSSNDLEEIRSTLSRTGGYLRNGLAQEIAAIGHDLGQAYQGEATSAMATRFADAHDTCLELAPKFDTLASQVNGAQDALKQAWQSVKGFNRFDSDVSDFTSMFGGESDDDKADAAWKTCAASLKAHGAVAKSVQGGTGQNMQTDTGYTFGPGPGPGGAVGNYGPGPGPGPGPHVTPPPKLRFVPPHDGPGPGGPGSGGLGNGGPGPGNYGPGNYGPGGPGGPGSGTYGSGSTTLAGYTPPTGVGPGPGGAGVGGFGPGAAGLTASGAGMSGLGTSGAGGAALGASSGLMSGAAGAGLGDEAAGAAGAAGAADGAGEGGMVGGMPMGGRGGGGAGGGDRDRSTWLVEEDDVWGGSDAPDGVIR